MNYNRQLSFFTFIKMRTNLNMRFYQKLSRYEKLETGSQFYFTLKQWYIYDECKQNIAPISQYAQKNEIICFEEQYKVINTIISFICIASMILGVCT